MKLRLDGYNERVIPDLGIRVSIGQEFECPDDIGDSLLAQNDASLTVWTQIFDKKFKEVK